MWSTCFPSTSSVAETKAKVTETLLQIAHKYNLEYVAFNQTQKACKHRKHKGPYSGKMRLEVGNENPAGLEPAPITPSDGESFQLMGATIKKIFGDDVVVAPSAVRPYNFEPGRELDMLIGST